METVKKHLISIVCGGVVLLAILLSFYPMSGMFSDLDSRLKQSEQELSKVKQAANVSVQFPTVDPSTPGPSVFPSERVYEAASRVVDAIVDASNNMMQQVVNLNAGDKQLLVRGSLPGGADLGIVKNKYPVALQQFIPQLRATLPVSDDEVTAAMPKPPDATDAGAAPPPPPVGRPVPGRGFRDPAWLEAERMAGRRGMFPGRGTGSVAEDSEERARKRDALALKRVNEFAMYVTPDFGGSGSGPAAGGTSSFDRHAGIPAPQDQTSPALQDVWAMQLSLWIQQDVVNAINEANRDSKMIETSVVKRLVSIDIPKEYITKNGPVAITDIRSDVGPVRAIGRAPIMRGGAQIGGVQPTDAAAQTGPLSPLVRDFTASPTGRICNKDYDVMHFTVTVDVDASFYGEFLAALQNNRCMTVLAVDMRGVDLEDAQRQGYLYGKTPMVQLVVKCEVLFFRQWTVIGDKNNPGPMPESVRDLLNISKQSAARTGGAGVVR